MCLPYWDTELDIEAGDWAFSNKELCAVSMAGLHSELLKKLASCALAMNSELLYICGTEIGAGGSMFWEESISGTRGIPGLSPFTAIWGYSSEIERFEAAFTARYTPLKAGVTRCTFWNRDVPLTVYKVVVLVTDLPVIDEVKCLTLMLDEFMKSSSRNELLPYYAERFGFLRAPVFYETDKPEKLLVAHKLESFQLDATRSVVGPSPMVSMPALYEISLGED